MKIIRPFFFGILAAFGALFLEIILGMFLGGPLDLKNIFSDQISPLLILAVIAEEISKFAFVYRRRLELKNYFQNSGGAGNLKKEIFLNSFFIGIGFSLLELLFIFFSLPSLGDVLDIKLAICGILIIHAATSALMGYLLAKYDSAKPGVVFAALMAAVASHLVYNFLIVYSVRSFFVFLYLLFIVFVFAAAALDASLKKAGNTGG